MLVDNVGIKISLSDKPNGHIFCSGMSGYGKTFFLDSLIKSNILAGISTVVLDYSGSFSEMELAKAGIRIGNRVRLIKPETDELYMPILQETKSNGDVLADVLVSTLQLKGYLNKKTLKEICRYVCWEGKISLMDILDYAAIKLDKSEETEEKKRLDNLIAKLEYLLPLKNITIVKKDGKEVSQKNTYIIDMNDMPTENRKVCVNFIMNILWHGAKKRLLPYRCIVLDECQHIDLKSGTVASNILREGRKYELSVYMATQFLRDRDSEEIETLMQANNKVFFRPTEREMRMVAGWIGKVEDWLPILENLETGQAVLKGKYFINDSKKSQEPIVINIRK